jgi:nitrous oxidase accessory protein NosD
MVEGPGIWGIMMTDGSCNIFYDNYVADYHDGYGVALGGYHCMAENNIFYRNTFVNNSKGVGYNWDLYGARNFWDNGKEGNYWSDYNGTDVNGDGVGDTPYIINENNSDRYPLMQPIVIP